MNKQTNKSATGWPEYWAAVEGTIYEYCEKDSKTIPVAIDEIETAIAEAQAILGEST
jgi:hypothetical protein